MARMASPKKGTAEDGKLCLYYWPQTSENWGHVSLKLSNGTYISWWPTEHVDKKYEGLRNTKIVADWVPAVRNNTLERDTKEEGSSPAVLIPQGHLNEKAILQWWTQFQSTHKYNGVRLNCSTTCYLALKAGGANTYCLDPGNWYWTPARCKQFASVMAEKMIEKGMKTPGSIMFKAESPQLEQLKLKADSTAKKGK